MIVETRRDGRRGVIPDMLISTHLSTQRGGHIDEENALLARVPQLEIVSTVGSGDAAFAGALHALAQGKKPEDALRLSMACGAANAVLGEVGSVRMEDVQAIANRIEIKTLEE